PPVEGESDSGDLLEYLDIEKGGNVDLIEHAEILNPFAVELMKVSCLNWIVTADSLATTTADPDITDIETAFRLPDQLTEAIHAESQHNLGDARESQQHCAIAEFCCIRSAYLWSHLVAFVSSDAFRLWFGSPMWILVETEELTNVLFNVEAFA
ncbi:hypothetical protein ACJX0J_017843, partial [Zea mays]